MHKVSITAILSCLFSVCLFLQGKMGLGVSTLYIWYPVYLNELEKRKSPSKDIFCPGSTLPYIHVSTWYLFITILSINFVLDFKKVEIWNTFCTCITFLFGNLWLRYKCTGLHNSQSTGLQHKRSRGRSVSGPG